MALTKVINDLADLNQSGSTNALKGCAGTTAQQPPSDSTVDYLIVGGGGGGGKGSGAGGGGAGGIVTGTNNPVYHGTPTVITVGEGGIGSTSSAVIAYNGNDSGFNGIRAIGGGSGGCENTTSSINDGNLGASGGGGCYYLSGSPGTGGAALQGNIGGTGGQGGGGGDYTGGGGGGASAVGTAGGSTSGGPGSGVGGPGGDGTDYTSFISVVNANLAQIGDTSNSTQVYFAGGGGGGSQLGGGTGTPGTGGDGGGGTGMPWDGVGNIAPTEAQNGMINTGGGAGGGTAGTASSPSGGSGVVVLKYDNTEITGYSLNSGDTATVNWPAGTFGVAYWPLNLNAKDIGGNYDGTATNITYTNGHFNQAASFNGSSSVIDLPNLNISGAATRTISAWIYVDSLSTQTIFQYGANSNGQRFGFAIDSAGKVYVEYYNRDAITSSAHISINNWYHVAVTYNGGAIETATNTQIYVDGTAVSMSSTGAQTGVANTANSDYGIGYRRASSDQYFDGIIEQVRFYGSALTASNITDIYNNSKPGSLQVAKTASDVTTSTCNFPSGVTGTSLYQFEGNKTDTCNNYTLTDGTYVPTYGVGKFSAQCAHFDGDSATTWPNNPQGFVQGDGFGAATGSLSSFSISAWLNLDAINISPNTNSFVFISYDYNPAGCSPCDGSRGWVVKINPTGNLMVDTYYSNTQTSTLTSSQALSINKWYHIGVTLSQTESKIYVNGILDSTNTLSSPSWNFYTGQDTNIGNGVIQGVPENGLNGRIDQFRFYSNNILDATNMYDLWQEENSIQTYFPDTPTSGTDTLVFKSGSGEISFTNDTAPGAEVGMLRYNSTLGQMEHFNSNGWKDFTSQINVDYLVVAGGGAGGGNYRAGGGGGGGLRTSYGSTSGGGSLSEPTFNVILGTLYSVEVGDAGQAASNTQGGNGGSSLFSTIVCKGGGGGSPYGTADGSSGGSGGGSAGHDNLTAGAGGSGTYNQGNDGGGGVTSSPICGGGGGGGAATPGYAYWDQATSGDGGAGLEVNIIGGTGNFYAGGGGGGNYGATYGNVTAGGVGGGGAGGSCLCTDSGVAGTTNTGGGGGGSAWAGIGSHGGSGIVILRYPNAYTLNLPTSGTLTIGVLNATVSGGSTDKYTTFISGTGNISFS